MPRTLSVALQTHVNLDTNTLATCWKLTRVDGTIFGFTSHTSDLTVSGQLYSTKTGATPTAIRSTLGTGIDNLDVLAVFDNAAITESDLLGGLYDNSSIAMFIVNYTDLTQGVCTLIKGTLGEITIHNGTFTAELRSNIQRAQQQIGSVLSSLCRAVDFGDAQCKYAGTILYTPFTVTTATSNSAFASTGIVQADNTFSAGKVNWLTGLNAGLSMEIKQQLLAGGTVTLQLAMPYTVAVGDTFSLYKGCDRTSTQCKIFGNLINFQGEPSIPGRDLMLVQPK